MIDAEYTASAISALHGEIAALHDEAPGNGECLQRVEKISEAHKKRILESADTIDPAETSGTVYYISSKSGNDENAGTSPDLPWRTLTRVNYSRIKKGDTVLLERGNIFRTVTFRSQPGITYSAYGEGEKPILCGSLKNYADPDFWEETEYPSVYKLYKKFRRDVGNIFFGVFGNSDGKKAVAALKKSVGLCGFTGLDDLNEDLSYFYSGDTAFNEGFIYLCSYDGNPGERFSDIEIAQPSALFGLADGVTVDNLTLLMAGTHGIGAGTCRDVSVTNCHIAYIGGSYWKDRIRFGNAVQIYGGCSNYRVENNYIHDVYDTAITNQYIGSDGEDCFMQDICYRGNLIENCYWSIEYYNSDRKDAKRTIHNMTVADNICRLNGYGWCEQRCDAGAYTLNSFTAPDDVKDFVVSYNIFDRARNGLIRFTTKGGDKNVRLCRNIYIQTPEKNLGMFYGTLVPFTEDAGDTLILNGEESPLLVFAPPL